jgi:hypothetical protein
VSGKCGKDFFKVFKCLKVDNFKVKVFGKKFQVWSLGFNATTNIFSWSWLTWLEFFFHHFFSSNTFSQNVQVSYNRNKASIAPHFEGSVRSPLTLPKMGLESPLVLPKIQSSIARVKTPCLGMFFIPLERSWSVNVQNSLAWVIWTFAAQVMVERRAESPNWDSFGTPNLGVPGQKAIWMWPPWSGIEYTIWGKVVASPESGPWWVKWVQSCPWLVLAPAVLQNVI